MPKLAVQNQFLDLSDYGRPFARFFANQLKSTRFTPIQVTLVFGVCGLAGVYCVLQNQYYFAAFFIILKSIIDAIDGELARAKNTPSYSGRYLDSIFDIILNFLLLLAIGHVSETSFWITFIAFICIQLQGTLYNYYYVIIRHQSKGADKTSNIFENKIPKALPGENQKAVNILFTLYTLFYGIFDQIIYTLEYDACKVNKFPNWFMTLLSFYGLGFQLLLMAILLSLNKVVLIAPFFISYSVLLFVLIGIRKKYIR
ncbi:CDP-alcohol phosphatidyltransferase family protein [Flavobacterium adhaerens]|uniref:CDP-alcohol phosphatidyltransferase family protein n=1 Tax=Flavobacterium adhaerens TaxID=3149043 RepID=UPI0032B34FFB